MIEHMQVTTLIEADILVPESLSSEFSSPSSDLVSQGIIQNVMLFHDYLTQNSQPHSLFMNTPVNRKEAPNWPIRVVFLQNKNVWVVAADFSMYDISFKDISHNKRIVYGIAYVYGPWRRMESAYAILELMSSQPASAVSRIKTTKHRRR